MEEYCFQTESCDNQLRIDKFLAEMLEEYSRSFLQKLIAEQHVLVDGRPVKANFRLKEGAEILVQVPEPEPICLEPEDIPLSILYEDEELLVVDKPKGMVVHPAAGHSSHTLVNALLFHCQGSLSGINGAMRPGIVHRIDRDTTGALIVCKTDRAHRILAEQLKVHSVTRKYRAVVFGNIREEEGTVDAPIGRHPTERKKMAVNYRNGKPAVTHYRVLQHFQNYAYIECQLETGRTHQIRVHMASIGHPLLGDTVYGPARQPYALEGQVLHAMTIGFQHPVTGAYMEFESPLPQYFTDLLKTIR